MKRSVALRVGRALLDLHDLKREQGLDWCAHSSWCSDQPVVVVLVRPGEWGEAEAKKPLGIPLVGSDVESAFRRAEIVLAEAIETLKRKRKERRRGSQTAR